VPGKRQLPTVRLRRLAGELRRLRAAADLTREEVADRTGINEATLYRLETGRARPQQRTLLSLLEAYSVPEAQREEIVALSKGADGQGWLRPYHSELSEQYSAYISFEAEAKAVRNYESSFIPGLLQTEDYARAVIRGVLPQATSRDVEQRVQARMERQAVLEKSELLQLWAIVDEAALHRVVGGDKVMREQLEHLQAMASEPQVTLQVIPFRAGAHPGMPGSFVLMSFPDAADPEIVYTDSMAGEVFLEAEADVSRYGLIFDNLRAIAMSPADSRLLIAHTMHEETP